MISRRELLASAPGALLAQRQAGSPPNVIVITMDDLGGKDLGCFGAADLKTPHLDALAAGGARCVNWYSNASVCAPARASIMTGRYPERTGLSNNGQPLSQANKSLATLLKPRGYATGAIGKWHLGRTPEARPNAHGFDYFYGFLSGCVDFYSHRYYWSDPRLVNYHDLWRNDKEIFEDGQYLTDRITAEAAAFIERSRQQPFFLYLAYNAPHYPMHAPEKYVKRFEHLPPERRMYAAMIAAVDDGVGEIRGLLRKHGLERNTLIIFAGDNGATTEKRAGLDQNWATAGDNGVYRGFKFSLFDGGTHVPAFVNWPGRIKPRTCDEVLMSMDIVPTVLEAAGSSLPDGYTVDGASALPVLTSGAPSPHQAIFWNQYGQMAVRKGDWKLVVKGRVYDRRDDGSKPMEGDDAVFLANLRDDPGEAKNLRRVHPAVVDELMTLIHDWRKSMPAVDP